MKLIRPSDQKVILEELWLAKSFKQRLLGLIPFPGLLAEQGLLIENCTAIHTFFMRFTIDCYFLDQNMEIVYVKKSLAPFRFFNCPDKRACHVLEVDNQRMTPLPLQVEEVLEVLS